LPAANPPLIGAASFTAGTEAAFGAAFAGAFASAGIPSADNTATGSAKSTGAIIGTNHLRITHLL
jgi:hypothetical protein